MVHESPPLVSVCMPVYNQAEYVGRALESVLSQSFDQFEVIVIDDCSTDGTPEAVAAIGDSRVRYFRQKERVGVARNRNACIAAARGRYLSWLDADDLYRPGALEVLTSALDGHPQAGLVHADFQLIDGSGDQIRTWDPPFAGDVVEPGRQAFEELVLSNYITTSTVMVRRQVLDQVGPFHAAIGQSSTDWDMWLRVALRADLVYRATPVASYRQHANTISRGATQSGERLRCDRRVLEHMFADKGGLFDQGGETSDRARAALAMRCLLFASDAFLRREHVAAWRAALEAFRLAGAAARGRDWSGLLVAMLRRDEWRQFHYSKRLLARLLEPLKETRYGRSVENLAIVAPGWQKLMAEVGATVRRLIPQDERIVVVDKHDPTLIHLSGRKGKHFPELRPDRGGNPRDSDEIVESLGALRSQGFSYFVLPQFAFWWLDFYEEFRSHLESSHRRVWADESCLIYELRPVRPGHQPSTRVSYG